MINNVKQKISSEKGITLVALLITIVIMLIIVGISVNTGMESADSTRLQGFYTKLEIIQKRADDIATTNESYIDSEGNTIYLKQAGTAYANLDADKKATLQNIVATEGEGIITNIEAFRYFTTEELINILDLSEIEYNVFIDFDTRTVIAEQGITANGETYHILKNNLYFAEQNETKNEGEIVSLGYNIYTYGTKKYKIGISPSNAIGDLNIGGTLKWKKTSTKYWESSSNLEMEINELTEYNVEYIDKNNNIISDTIKVQLDKDGDPIVISSKYWSQNKTAVVKMDENGNTLQTLEVGQEVKLKIGTEDAVTYRAGDYTGSWVVLGAEYGRLLLVSESNVVPTGLALDYPTGKATLNARCAQYLNKTYATKARSIRVEDINRVTGYNPETAGYGSGQSYQYGNEVTYTLNIDGDGNATGMNINSDVYNGFSDSYKKFLHPDGQTMVTDTEWETITDKTGLRRVESVKIYANYYEYYPDTLTTSSSGDTNGIATDSNAYKLLFNNTSGEPYWLADQYAEAKGGYVYFGLRGVWGEKVSGSYRWGSYYGRMNNSNLGVRPVVVLKSNVQVVTE